MKVSVCLGECVIVDFLSFKLRLGCLFSPHHVSQGVVQKTTPQVTLYKPHTTLYKTPPLLIDGAYQKLVVCRS